MLSLSTKYTLTDTKASHSKSKRRHGSSINRVNLARHFRAAMTPGSRHFVPFLWVGSRRGGSGWLAGQVDLQCLRRHVLGVCCLVPKLI